MEESVVGRIIMYDHFPKHIAKDTLLYTRNFKREYTVGIYIYIYISIHIHSQEASYSNLKRKQTGILHFDIKIKFIIL